MNQREQELIRLEDACGDLLAETEPGSKPRIAAWGLVKAGKSSLLNMLSGNIENEFFKTGVVRTTRTNCEFETDNYVLVDTPGLGIDEGDSKQAFKGLDSADVTLFIHAPQGELDQEEIDLLAQVKAAYAEKADRRLILVLSLLDRVQSEAMDNISCRILEQLKEHIGVQPICFKVSNTRFRKGVTENKSGLTEKSGIPELAQHLDKLSVEIESQLEGVRSSRKQTRRSKLLNSLDKAIEEERRIISSFKSPYIEKAHAFNKMMKDLKKDFSSHDTEIRSAHKAMNSIK